MTLKKMEEVDKLKSLQVEMVKLLSWISISIIN